MNYVIDHKPISSMLLSMGRIVYYEKKGPKILFCKIEYRGLNVTTITGVVGSKLTKKSKILGKNIGEAVENFKRETAKYLKKGFNETDETLPHVKLPKIRQPKATLKTKSSFANKLLDQKNRFEKNADIEETLIFSGPIPESKVAMIENKLKCKLPDDYVELLTSLGCFKVVDKSDVDKAYKKILQSKFEILHPDKVIELTKAERKAYLKYVDQETIDNLNQSVLFQTRYGRGDYYTFRCNDGSIHNFRHDDHYKWTKKILNFKAHIQKIINEIS